MQADLLDTDEVLTRQRWYAIQLREMSEATYFSGRNVGRDCGTQRALTVGDELEWVELSTPFSDLEPVGSASVPARGSLTRRNLAEVDGGRAWVVESVVEFESNGGSSGDSDSLRGTTRAISASHTARADIFNG